MVRRGVPNGEFVEVYAGEFREPTFEGLHPGISYFCRVACVNASGRSDYSKLTIVKTDPIPPEAPPRPVVRALGSSQLEVRWTGPSKVGGSAVKSYRLQMTETLEQDGCAGWLDVYNGPQLSFVAADLAPGAQYGFRVFASNTAGESPCSGSAVAATRPDKPGACAAPTATVLSATALKLNWVPAAENGAKIVEYLLEMSRCGPVGGAASAAVIEDQSLNFAKVFVGPTHETVCSNLSPATGYAFRVKASNVQGPGPVSAVTRASTACAAPDAPRAPTVLRADGTSVTIQWDSVVDHGAPITS